MNILYYYSSQQIHTGSPRVLISLISGLDKTKYSPFFLSGERGDLFNELKKLNVSMIAGVNNTISKRSFIKNIGNIFVLIRALINHKIDLLHVNELGWNFEIVVAAWFCRIPVVFHIHNPSKFQKNNLNCKIGSRFLFVSKMLAKQCEAEAVVGQRTEILYNPVDIDYFAGGQSIRSKLNLSEDIYVVGTVAQICHRKGVDIFLETADKILEKCPNTKFLIVGPDAIGEEVYSANLREKVSNSSFSENIFFLGPRNDIPDILASLDVFFLPTRSEPFGLVFVEAIAAHVPVVATNVGGIPEIIPSDKYGIVRSINNNWSQSIVDLLKNKNKRDDMTDNAFNRVENRFSSDKFFESLDSIYCKYNK